MESLYEMPIARPPGRPPVADDRDHVYMRGRAAGMREAGMRRNAVARRLGVSRQTLFRWERLDAITLPPKAS